MVKLLWVIGTHGVDPERIKAYCKEISELVKTGVEIAIVIGGGNIFRGLSAASNGMDRVQADYMGMLATVINGLALQSTLEESGIQTRLQTALKMESIAEPYIKRRAVRHLEKRELLFLALELEILFLQLTLLQFYEQLKLMQMLF